MLETMRLCRCSPWYRWRRSKSTGGTWGHRYSRRSSMQHCIFKIQHALYTGAGYAALYVERKGVRWLDWGERLSAVERKVKSIDWQREFGVTEPLRVTRLQSPTTQVLKVNKNGNAVTSNVELSREYDWLWLVSHRAVRFDRGSVNAYYMREEWFHGLMWVINC